MKYDERIKVEVSKETIVEYGVLQGNNSIFILIGGKDSTLEGYNQKYINIASYLNKMGYTVLVASNKYDGHDTLGFLFDSLSEVCERLHFTHIENFRND